MHETIRANIRRLMLDAGIKSEADLAARAGVVQSTLNRYLAGRTEQINYSALKTIADYFKVTVSDLDGSATRHSDPKIAQVVHVMEHLPEYRKDALVATGNALAQLPESNGQAA